MSARRQRTCLLRDHDRRWGRTWGAESPGAVLVDVGRVVREGDVAVGYGRAAGGRTLRFLASPEMVTPCRMWVDPADRLEDERMDPVELLEGF